MAYEILQFNLGTDRAQGYVLRGTAEHEGTNVSLSAHDVMAHATDGKTLVRFLDRAFIREHALRMSQAPPSDTQPIAVQSPRDTPSDTPDTLRQ